MSPSAAATVVILSVFLAPPAPAAIYRCPTDDGPPRFSQFPCAGEAELVLDTLQVVEVPPISAAEQAVLDGLQRERNERRAARSRARQKAARAASREREARNSRCRSARSALDALDRQRRKGYSLQQARDLDSRERELEVEIRANC